MHTTKRTSKKQQHKPASDRTENGSSSQESNVETIKPSVVETDLIGRKAGWSALAIGAFGNVVGVAASLLVVYISFSAIENKTSISIFLKENGTQLLNLFVGISAVLLTIALSVDSRKLVRAITRTIDIFFGIDRQSNRTAITGNQNQVGSNAQPIDDALVAWRESFEKLWEEAEATFNSVFDPKRSIENSGTSSPMTANSSRSTTSVEQLLSGTLQRIERERQTLSLRTGLNVVAGIIIVAVGVFVLWNFVNHLDAIDFTASKAITVVSMRLSIVLFLSIFALFFLNQYRSGLADMKYYVNEYTNISAMYAAIKIATDLNDKKLLHEISKLLLSTERNFVLRKGESTIGIAQMRAEHQLLDTLSSRFANLLPVRKPVTKSK